MYREQGVTLNEQRQEDRAEINKLRDRVDKLEEGLAVALVRIEELEAENTELRQ